MAGGRSGSGSGDGSAPPHSLPLFAPKPQLQPLPALTSSNFRQWRIVLGAHLACFGLDHLLDPNANATEEQQKQAKSYVIGSLTEHDYPHIQGKSTLHELVEALRTARHGKIEQHQVQLASRLLSLRIAPGESITEFCNKMRACCNQLEDAGVPFGDLLLAVWTLTCARLDARFTAQCDIMLGLGVKLTMDHVQAALKSVEHAGEMQVPSATGLAASGGVNTKPAEQEPSALAALAKRVNQLSSTLGQLKKTSRPAGSQRTPHQPYQQPQQRPHPYQRPSSTPGFRCLNCKGFNHSWKECRKPCQSCGRLGHSAHLCRTNPPNRTHQPSARTHFTAADQVPDEEAPQPTGYAFMHAGLPMPSPFRPGMRSPRSLHNGKTPSIKPTTRSKKFDWILDGGATHHMTYRKDLLHDFIPCLKKNDVEVAANVLLDLEGYGTLRFQSVINGVKHSREIKNVWYVPKLTVNLISGNQLKEAGCMIVGGVMVERRILCLTGMANLSCSAHL